MDYLLQFEDLTRSFISHLNIGLPTLPGVDLTAPETVGDLNLGSTFGDINLGSDFSGLGSSEFLNNLGSSNFLNDLGSSGQSFGSAGDFGSSDWIDVTLNGLGL